MWIRQFDNTSRGRHVESYYRSHVGAWLRERARRRSIDGWCHTEGDAVPAKAHEGRGEQWRHSHPMEPIRSSVNALILENVSAPALGQRS